MANISDLSGDEREQRIAELKKKMQAAAEKRAQEPPASPESSDTDVPEETVEAAADTVEVEEPTAAPAAELEPGSETDSAPADLPASAADETEPDGVEVSPSEKSVTEESAAKEIAAPVAEADSDAPKISEVAALTAAATGIPAKPEKTEEQKLKSEMNRREFLVYSWGAAMGLVLLGTGVATFQFMYPRFKAGEFGGAFLMGLNSALPPTDAAPEAVPDGKFWWINTDEVGPRALYMVCTHLGCLYKWVDERDRFECPCHGSKFTREGLYIEGPAPRSLDHFVTELVDDVWVVDTGAKVNGAPASESTAAGTG